jgi:hypothetical protein
MLTIEELKEKIVEQVDEVDIIDLLGITTQDIVNAFEDRVEELHEKIKHELDLTESEDFED